MAINISNIAKEKNKEKKTGSSSSGGIMDFLNKDIQLFGRSLSDKKKERFYAELAILLQAGVDIRASLDLIIGEQKGEKDKALFNQIKDDVIGGDALSEAILRTGKFSDHEYYNLQIGEETGKLPHILTELGIFFQKKIKQRRQFTGAMMYPALVLSVAAGAIAFMFLFIVPMFADVFGNFGGELPAITKVIINTSEWFANYFWMMFLGFWAVVGMLLSQRKKTWLRDWSSRILLATPIFGPLTAKIYLARFCHGMQLMTSAKIPLLKAIGLAGKMISFYPIEEGLKTVEKDILQGHPLHTSLAKFSIFNTRMVSLIKVGEEVNQLDAFFDKIAQQYTEEVEHQTSMLGNVIEPLLIIFLGLVVGIILVSMYLPLFQMGSAFGN